jgi:hypothetical protein
MEDPTCLDTLARCDLLGSFTLMPSRHATGTSGVSWTRVSGSPCCLGFRPVLHGNQRHVRERQNRPPCKILRSIWRAGVGIWCPSTCRYNVPGQRAGTHYDDLQVDSEPAVPTATLSKRPAGSKLGPKVVSRFRREG